MAKVGIIGAKRGKRPKKIARNSRSSRNMGAKDWHSRPFHQMLQVVGMAGFLLESTVESSMVCTREIRFCSGRALDADKTSAGPH